MLSRSKREELLAWLLLEQADPIPGHGGDPSLCLLGILAGKGCVAAAGLCQLPVRTRWGSLPQGRRQPSSAGTGGKRAPAAYRCPVLAEPGTARLRRTSDEGSGGQLLQHREQTAATLMLFMSAEAIAAKILP